MSLNFWIFFCVLALLVCSCGKRPDPYGSQLSRATEASFQGQELLDEGEVRRAEKSFQKSLRINRGIDNPVGTSGQLNNLAAVAMTRGDLAEAKKLFQQALFINQDLGDAAGAAINLANLATLAQRANDLPKAGRYLDEALDMARLSGSAKVKGQVLCQMAGLALDQKDLATAAAYLEEARAASSRDAEVRGSWNYQQGRLSLARGDTFKALTFFQEALKSDRSILNRAAMAADLTALGETWEAQGDFSQSFLYYSRAFELYATMGSRDKALLCLESLRRVNQTGSLGRPLQLYEQQFMTTDRADATCPPAVITTENKKVPGHPPESIKTGSEKALK